MSARFKANNFIAVLIAIILMAIGFTLYFINERMVSAREESPAAQVQAAAAQNQAALDDVVPDAVQPPGS